MALTYAVQQDERRYQAWYRDPVPWVVGLFLVTFLLQRIAVPGLPIPMTVPITMAWLVAVFVLDVVELNRTRLLVWLFTAGLSLLLVVVQVFVLAKPYTSPSSWALWMMIWAPLVVQVKHRDPETYLRCMRGIARVGVGLSALSLSFVATQLVGIRYYDWLAAFVPSNLLVQNYVVAYPIVYGSPIYKSNGWLALEPSFMSFFLAVTVIAALLCRASMATVVFLAAGMLSTVAGSGLALVLVFVVALGVQGRLAPLRRYLVPLGLVGGLFATTVLGEAILGRVTELGSSNSSASMRAIEPYIYLWPYWIADPIGIFVGHGPGASATVVVGGGVNGLLVPSVGKVIFDYGLLGGAGLVVLMAVAFLRAPSSAFGFSLAASMFLLQAASPALVVCSVLVLTLWSPPTPSTATSRPAPTPLPASRSGPVRRPEVASP